MNFPDRVRVLRRRTTPTGYVQDAVVESTPCRFEMLSAAMYTLWGDSAGYQILSANMHLPLTITDFPEPGYDLVDYTIEVLWPKLGWIEADGLKTWKITNKRFTRNHVLYLITIKES
jgi:hypothetical protein